MPTKSLAGFILISFWAFLVFFASCSKPDPIAFTAKVGMKKKQIVKLLGKPLYSGGFVASVEPAAAYTPQRDRFLLFYVYPDSSLIIFRRDTVYQIYGNVRPYKQRLAQEAQRRNQRSGSEKSD